MLLPTEIEQLNRILLEANPQSAKFLRRRFEKISDEEASVLEFLAKKICKYINGKEKEYIEDYIWYSARQLEEELLFRRNQGQYRYTSLAECIENVYSDDLFMERYMNALLMTQIWWSNHSLSVNFFRKHFLSSLVELENDKLTLEKLKCLEVGPGHGLLISMLCESLPKADITVWDISQTSLEQTKDCLIKFGVENEITFEKLNITEAGDKGSFDAIVFSEVLEHLDEPFNALCVLRKMLTERGILYLNMPINSPAPDHLFNLPSPSDLANFVERAGFQILKMESFPATNYSLADCEKNKLTISNSLVLSKYC